MNLKQKLNNKSIKIILIILILTLLSLGIAYASGAFLGGSNEVSLTKGLVGHWKLDQNTYDEYTENLLPQSLREMSGTSGWIESYYTSYSREFLTDFDGRAHVYKLVHDGTESHDWYSSVNLPPTQVGEEYVFSLDYKVTLGTDKPNSPILYQDGWKTGGSATKEFLYDIDLGNGWRRIAHKFTITYAGTPRLRMSVGYTSNEWVVYMDNFQFEKKPYSTPYTNGIRESKVTDSTPYENHGVTNAGLDVPHFTTDRLGNEKGALEFDGVDDDISLSPFDFDEDSIFSGSAWIKLNQYSTDTNVGSVILEKYGGNKGFFFAVSHDGRLRFRGHTGVGTLDYTTTETLSLNTWYHVNYVVNNTNLKLYINSIKVKDITFSTPYLYNSAESLNIGSWNENNFNFNGAISDVRIYDRALSEEEIKLLYDSHKPQTTGGHLNKGLIAHYPLNDVYETKDITPNENHGINEDLIFTTNRKNVVNESIDLDDSIGTNFIKPVDIGLNLNSESISFWMKCDFPRQDSEEGSFSNWIIQWGDYDSSNSGGFGLQSGNLAYYIKGSTNSGWSTSGTLGSLANSIYDEGDWVYYTIIFEGNNKIKIYMNGNEIKTATISDAFTGYSHNKLNFGKNMVAYLDDVRIYNRALSEEEIKLLYDSYNPQTTVSSLNYGLVLDMPLTSTWTKSETTGSEILTDKTPYSNDGQNYGSNVGDDYSTLNGIDDHFRIQDSDSLHNQAFGLTDTFTLSAWAYPIEWANWATIINHANGVSWSNTLNGMWAYTSGFRCVMGSGVGGNPSGSSIGPSYNPGLNNWNHVVCIADGTNLKMYVNGVYRGQSPISSLTYPRTELFNPITIGRRATTKGPSFNGHISNIKAYNRALSEDEVKLLYEKGRY